MWHTKLRTLFELWELTLWCKDAKLYLMLTYTVELESGSSPEGLVCGKCGGVEVTSSALRFVVEGSPVIAPGLPVQENCWKVWPARAERRRAQALLLLWTSPHHTSFRVLRLSQILLICSVDSSSFLDLSLRQWGRVAVFIALSLRT